MSAKLNIRGQSGANAAMSPEDCPQRWTPGDMRDSGLSDFMSL